MTRTATAPAPLADATLARAGSEFVTAFGRDEEARGTAVLLGVLCVVGGVLLVRHPGTSLTAIALIVGVWLLATGAVHLAWTAAYDRRLASAAVGAVQLVAGVVIVAAPGIGVATLAVLAGVSLLLNGLVLIGVGRLARVQT